ncbi:hypothetical protein [Flavobacterium sp. MK4S-17]|uniref:hypothetical protein n=1 Tax=Flavobacterium sp. MK4S-17 TaxID=2543737 RepID=UPI0013599545|nr:hypothetical protein [Flavobacterium sp. MK4S-17]
MKKQSYINYLWNSVNEHSIHSPFMFGFANKAFYSPAPSFSRREYKDLNINVSYRQAELLYKITCRLRPAKLLVLGNEAESVTKLLRYAAEKNNIQLWFFSTLAPVPGGIDMAYISVEDEKDTTALLEQVIKEKNNTTFCIAGNIHASGKTEKTWKAIKNHKQVTVTADAYFAGFVFFRPGQAKQHFMIRSKRSFFLDAILGLRNLYGLLG